MFIISFRSLSATLCKVVLIAISITMLALNCEAQRKRFFSKNKKQEVFNSDSIQGCVNCLRMGGRISIAKNNNAILIKIFLADSLVYTLQSNNASGRFEFYLPYNNMYNVLLSKPGYYDKFMTVDTRFPKNKYGEKYEVAFTTEMFKTMEGLDVEILKQPLVELKYDKPNDLFDFDPQYTQRIIDKIYKLYSDYRYLMSLDEDVLDLALKKAGK